MRFGMRWCDPAKSLNVVSVYTVHCTVGFLCSQKSANSSYGVKKISHSDFSIVIKRCLMVFCWSCDGNPWKKSAEPPVCHYWSNEPSLDAQFEWSVNTFNSHEIFCIKVINCWLRNTVFQPNWGGGGEGGQHQEHQRCLQHTQRLQEHQQNSPSLIIVA